jgi:tetraprenyl-beta-curcumene synthase
VRKRPVADRLELARVFAGATPRYWLAVFPEVCRELGHWRHRAAAIEDAALRALALAALEKRGNIEGAAAFAAFTPRAHRRAVVRALTAFQAAYNYADMLAEQPSADPVGNGRRLHEALLLALDPGAVRVDYYEHYPRREGTGREGAGYLDEIVERCRAALATLPSYAAVAPAAQRAAARIVACQSLSLGEHGRAQEDLEHWGREHIPAGAELEWWEAAAAGGSSLGVYALIATAAEPAVDPAEIAAIEHAYFPWIGSLHSLLDSFVDEAEDAEIGQLSLVGCYACRADAAHRMGSLAARAVRDAKQLPGGERHAVLVAAMAGYYLSSAQVSEADALPIARNVSEAMGALTTPVRLVFGTRRLLARRRLMHSASPRT